MKIYPSKHRIKKIEDSNIDKDISIPLAYLNEDNVSYSITSTPSSDFSLTETIELLPNRRISNEDVYIFDEYGNKVDSSTLINRVEGAYCYRPNNMIEFDPLKFSYTIVAKKKLSYSISNRYNIDIGCMDDPSRPSFANRLTKILMTPSDKGYISNNISFNNNKADINTFLQVDEATNFVFLESIDGLYYNYLVPDIYQDIVDTSENTKTNIVYESFLKNNTNMWIVSDEHYKYAVTRGINLNVEVKNPRLKKGRFNIKNYYNVSEAVYSNLKIHNIFTSEAIPVLITEHENQGFIIYSSSELFEEDKIEYYKDLIYEVLLYVYCNSYKTSTSRNECITYSVPDYEYLGQSTVIDEVDAQGNVIYKQNKSFKSKNCYITKETISSIVGLNDGDFEIREVNIIDNNDNLAVPDTDLVSTVDNILYRLSSDRKHIVFELDSSVKNTSIYQEPNKPTGWKSLLYNNKVYYLEQIHYLMETNIQDSKMNKLFLIEDGMNLVVRLYPFKSSKYGLNITKDLRLVIPYIKTTIVDDENIEKELIKNESYVVYINRANNNLEYLFESDYEESYDKVFITLIQIVKTRSDQYLTDMRLKGGGLPEDMPDNFNLLDIGHIYGRPYRKANTLVITLPKKYEQYKNEILEVINKYKVAEDYPILFFEDDETDGEI